MNDKKIKKRVDKPKLKKLEFESYKDCQHIKILFCDRLVNQVIYECWYCRQGLLSEIEGLPPQQIEVMCPNCNKPAIRLMASKVLSTTEIPSPWKS